MTFFRYLRNRRLKCRGFLRTARRLALRQGVAARTPGSPLPQLVAATVELERVPGNRDRLPEPEEPPGQPDVDVDLEGRSQGPQDPQIERNRSLGRLAEEALREDDVGSPRRVAGLPSRVPPERPLLGDQEAVAGVTPFLLVVEDALAGTARRASAGGVMPRRDLASASSL